MRTLVHTLAYRSYSVLKLYGGLVLLARDVSGQRIRGEGTTQSSLSPGSFDQTTWRRWRLVSGFQELDWEQDSEFKQDLKRYVLQNLSRREILDFVSRDYAQYAWIHVLGTLSRRLAYFDEYNTDRKEVEAGIE